MDQQVGYVIGQVGNDLYGINRAWKEISFGTYVSETWT